MHNSLISRDIKAKSTFRQILAAEGAEQCDKIYYHIAKLPKHNELCIRAFRLRCHICFEKAYTKMAPQGATAKHFHNQTAIRTLTS